MLDKRARVLREEADDGTAGRPEIDRGDLRDLLFPSAPWSLIDMLAQLDAEQS